MTIFKKFVYTPAGFYDVTLAIAACRAGGIGIFNTELCPDFDLISNQLDFLAQKTSSEFGLKLDCRNKQLLDAALSYSQNGLKWLILDCDIISACRKSLIKLREKGIRILAETKTCKCGDESFVEIVDGLVLKGNEAGGFVGENSSFILLQKWFKQTDLPLYIHGGLTPHVAAACSALGVAGGVFDTQVLLLEESPLAQTLRPFFENLSGNETIAAGDGEVGAYFRLLVRPALTAAKDFCAKSDGLGLESLYSLAQDKVNWQDPKNGLLPVGQDVCFANLWRKKYGHMAAVFKAVDSAVDSGLSDAVKNKSFSKNAPLAQALGTSLPIVQGPMARVSDRFEFALAISRGGALPMVALALLKGQALNKLLKETSNALKGRTWGIGVLGFAPQALQDEQLASAVKYKPDFAIIAGGRPDHAVKFEKEGILSFLHVPSSNLIPMFIEEGAGRFIFEGRECGGHIGPLSSFVLWSSMVDCLLNELDKGKASGTDIEVLFAGGIHDAVSSALVQVLAAPLVKKGVKIGIIMGSGYLFTREIVSTGAIVPAFQKEVVACEHTVNLESGPGHASRCAYTSFAKEFFEKHRQLQKSELPTDERRKIFDDLIMGRLRIASKGCARVGPEGTLQEFDESRQHKEGMYMLGQLAILRENVTDISTLHGEVTDKANKLLADRLNETASLKTSSAEPLDIAVVGIGSLLPKADSTEDYWRNILNKVEAISEIPPHRWDWRLYYDKDRQAKDKIYSRWGGFLNDFPFDPTRYGMPPKSIKSVDPMQLMALEVARKTLADAGYEDRGFDRERASVIIGASGGAGDVGMQYGLRAELPRFKGNLPDEIADRLPEWTEDTFAGILLNVMAGRIANRLNLGGVNFTTDAACASSLAAIYQGVSELVNGRSNMVIAGGVDTVQGPFGYMCFSKTQALSPRDRCRTFDEEADGIIISEGIAMVALKRLEEAERDGDRIYAVIKGVGGSSDGRAKGLTAPSPAGQLRAMRRAYEQAGFGPETVTLFEAHGTGTVAGDTAELESTTSLLKEAGAGPRQAVVGSVKTLIGHTKATAGIAGMIKAVLSLHTHILPPHHGVTVPNQVLQQADCPLYLIDKALPWLSSRGIPRRAASSAFGFGGTNFHVVLEEYKGEYRPWMRPVADKHWPVELFLFSAADKEALTGMLRLIKENLVSLESVELCDLACSLADNRQEGGECLAIVSSDLKDLSEKIESGLKFLTGETADLKSGVYYNDGTPADGKLAVLFSGQGSQYTYMLRELGIYFSELADVLTETDDLLADAYSRRFGNDVRLSHFIFPRGTYDKQAQAAAEKALTGTDVAQPALGAVEAGLWRLMQLFNLKPDMCAGHSYGEFVALFAAGIIDLETLMLISEARGRLIVDAAKASGGELGGMAAVMAPRDEVEKMIAGIDNLIVANHNSPLQCIISGSEFAINKAVEKISKAKIKVRALPVAAAFHSSFVEPAQKDLAAVIDAATWHAGEIPVYSNTTAEPHSRDADQIKQLMTDHLVKPVEFVAEIEAMYRDGARIFLEIGPKSVLSGLTARILEGRPHKALAVEGHGPGISGLLHTLAQLLCAGVKLDIQKIFAGRNCKHGDPNNPATMQSRKPFSKLTWMLNGSGARRITEPVRQIGLRLEEVKAATGDAQQDNNALLTSSSQCKLSERGRDNVMKDKYRKENSLMRRKLKEPTADESGVMAKYFETMHQFLETQEHVMSMYLGGSSAERSVAARIPRHAPRRPSRQTPEVVDIARKATVEAAGKPAAPLPDKAEQTPAPSITAQPAETPAESSTTGSEETTVDRKKMTDIVLAVVEDKTGYPKDMVGLDQNLEADLGIDSIKMIEVVGAILRALPEKYGRALGEDRKNLNTQLTINAMLDMLEKLEIEGGEAERPFSQAGMDSVVLANHPSRHILEAKLESIDSDAQKQLNKGLFLITEDALGIASALAGVLREKGCTVSLIERKALGDETILRKRCSSLLQDNISIAGIVHLGQLGSDWLPFDATLTDFRKQLLINEKSFFMLLHNLSSMLDADAHILSAGGLGGFFNRNMAETPAGISLQGGAVGLLKSLHEERPELRVKAIDLDLQQSETSMVKSLLNELELSGGRQEVGYPAGKRTIFQTVPVEIDAGSKNPAAIKDIVVLTTGGLRGVTAETLRELALPGNTLLLTGRSILEEQEPAELQPLITAASLQQHLIGQVRAGHIQLTPAEIRRKVEKILAAREMRNNIADFRKRGAKVEYFAVDVTDEDAMKQLLDNIYEKFGTLDGVVHGAGVIEDKLLADKTADSWTRVVETKVIGLILLQKYIRPESLRFFIVFSSVAGRYGNSGQTDYATANELMNRLCCQLKIHWPKEVNVRSLCWGPWGRTKFGTGMVTAEIESKFAQRGVSLVSADSGRKLFRDELTDNNCADVEIICGAGPWEQHEAAIGRIKSKTEVSKKNIQPLLENAALSTLPKGEQMFTFTLGDNHFYLQEHCIDGVPVLPAAVALEMMAEAAASLWPGWLVVEVNDCRALKGIQLKRREQSFNLVISPPPYGSSEGFDVAAVIQSDQEDGKKMIHYRAVLRLEQLLMKGFERTPHLHSEKQLSVAKAYNEWLFHGPGFQVIEKIDGLSDSGAGAHIRSTVPADWINNIDSASNQWVFDSAVIDAAAQMALLWARAFRNESALPARFGRVVRYVDVLPEKLCMDFERIISDESHLVRANVYFTDADNQVVFLLEDMECISSAALNRLGGTAGKGK